MLRISSKAMSDMINHCRRDFPDEACGYLAGSGGIATCAFPVENAHRSPTSYQMEPGAQLALHKQLRQLKLEPMAIYHSHVATQAYPSRRDIDNATAVQDFFEGHYVLVTLKDPTPGVRAFTIRDGNVTEEEIREE